MLSCFKCHLSEGCSGDFNYEGQDLLRFWGGLDVGRCASVWQNERGSHGEDRGRGRPAKSLHHGTNRK